MTCKDCIHLKFRLCYRYPPVVYNGPDGLEFFRPEVYEDTDACGEFSTKRAYREGVTEEAVEAARNLIATASPRVLRLFSTMKNSLELRTKYLLQVLPEFQTVIRLDSAINKAMKKVDAVNRHHFKTLLIEASK